MKKTITRRAMLATVATIAPVAALAAVPLDTGELPQYAADDAELLALVAEFHRLEEVHQEVWTAYKVRRSEMEKSAPPLSDPRDHSDKAMAQDRKHRDYLDANGCGDLYDRACRAGSAAGMMLREVFKTPARTPAGILAKVELYRLAYGSDPQGAGEHGEVAGNVDLDAYDVDYWTDYDDVDENGEAATVDDPDWRPWLDTIVADLRALAGEVRA
ncbi:MAG: hypothetical protein ACK4QW_06620 [Alphaproteobacteria bacterium]